MTDSKHALTFHCGLPKTGSSFLQARVFPRAEGGTYIPGKLPLAYVVEYLSSVDTSALVSDERFTWTPLARGDLESRKRERMLAYLANTWPGSRLLLFLREPSEMVRSHYAQYLHEGGFLTFNDFCRHHILREAFRFDLLLDAIADMPWQDLLLIDYRDFVDQPELTIALVETFTGMRFPGWQQAMRMKRRNASVSGYGAKLLRSSNAFMIRGYPAHGLGLPKKLLRRRRAVRRMIQSGPLRFLNSLGPDLTPRDSLERIRLEYESSWEEVRHRIAASQAGRLPSERPGSDAGARA